MIVIGYTADRFGQAALDHGIEQARLRDTGVLVINSTAGDAYADSTFAQSDGVRDLQARLSTSGVPFEFSQPVGVDAATELLTAMDRPEAEMLVIGIKHRNPVGKLLMGSVSQQVLLECPKPVLAVKPAE
ncbi:universal stress protein [Mycolicibacterium sp. GCM10028919]|jgi:nucleotide-binding universal stress UspA family protein|uniref:Universal stress protein n=1 Tax=Mycolicibacterium arabiense TaxID=1286181 RepID=A0A7I7RSD6_9MYCO|nr:universal stress protein [Mycolicibacterium arabiense]MBJ7383217.1 universal stress protein [Mycolicibacterium sp.]MCV7376221.1 universal stress protein [Mycolicibacterium arabiense]BBY47090.1 universal stress protein [Mycolicibacterium arabiense]